MATEKRAAPPTSPDPASPAAKLERKIAAQTARKQQNLAERASRKITAKTVRGEQKVAEKAARHAEQIDRHAAQIDRLAAQLESLAIWTRTEPGGRRPRFSRQQIAETAIRIADAEGADALSMRRIATELDAGTMTLYHYVRTKDELLALVTDAVMGEVVIPADEPLPAGWREALTLIAHRSRAVFARHPWMLDITDDPPFGPNSVRHFDQSLQAVASLPVDLATKIDFLMTVDEYVFGHCLQQRNNVQPDDQLDPAMLRYVEGLVGQGGYPALTALIDEHGLTASWDLIEATMRDPGRFERNLTRLLDGLEASLRT